MDRTGAATNNPDTAQSTEQRRRQHRATRRHLRATKRVSRHDLKRARKLVRQRPELSLADALVELELLAAPEAEELAQRIRVANRKRREREDHDLEAYLCVQELLDPETAAAARQRQAEQQQRTGKKPLLARTLVEVGALSKEQVKKALRSVRRARRHGARARAAERKMARESSPESDAVDRWMYLPPTDDPLDGKLSVAPRWRWTYECINMLAIGGIAGVILAFMLLGVGGLFCSLVAGIRQGLRVADETCRSLLIIALVALGLATLTAFVIEFVVELSGTSLEETRRTASRALLLRYFAIVSAASGVLLIGCYLARVTALAGTAGVAHAAGGILIVAAITAGLAQLWITGSFRHATPDEIERLRWIITFIDAALYCTVAVTAQAVAKSLQTQQLHPN